jgi:penicillin-binding protein 2
MNDPEVVLTVMVESGGEGSKVAGPIAREIFDYYFAIEAQKE